MQNSGRRYEEIKFHSFLVVFCDFSVILVLAESNKGVRVCSGSAWRFLLCAYDLIPDGRGDHC